MTDPGAAAVPEVRLYDHDNNLWVQATGSGAVLVGIDEVGIEALGELAFIALHEPGTIVQRGDAVGTLEAAKMTTPIFAPVSGVLSGRNESVVTDPLLVNRAPYGDGWLVELDPTDWDRDKATLAEAPNQR